MKTLWLNLRWLGLGALLLLCGCSPKGALFLTIEGQDALGPLAVPAQVDRVRVEVLTPDRQGLFTRGYELTADQRFPLTLGLEPGEETPEQVRVVVTLSRGETPVGAAEALLTFTGGETTLATVRVVVD